jgi:hypothetical protein
VSPVKYEMGLYIPEDDILHSHSRENVKSYNELTSYSSRCLMFNWCVCLPLTIVSTAAVAVTVSSARWSSVQGLAQTGGPTALFDTSSMRTVPSLCLAHSSVNGPDLGTHLTWTKRRF